MRRRFEVPVLVAALCVVPVIFIEETTPEGFVSLAYWANWIIWAVFLAEYVTVLVLTDERWAYTRKAWLDVFIIVSSFPALGTLLASTRLLRLARLGRLLRMMRLVRLAAVVTRGGMAVRAVFRSRGLGYLTMSVVLVALGVGGAFAIFERTDIGDALWWAIVTVTTVGYGDLVPTTPGGRAVAVVLMLLGIGFVALLTATVAAHFVGGEEADTREEISAEVQRIHSRLDDLERLLLDKREDNG